MRLRETIEDQRAHAVTATIVGAVIPVEDCDAVDAEGQQRPVRIETREQRKAEYRAREKHGVGGIGAAQMYKKISAQKWMIDNL